MQTELRANQTIRMALFALQGTVFFGCPHPTEAHRELWPKMNTLLEYYGKFDTTYLNMNEKFIPQVTDLCSRFERSGTGGILLSIFEKNATRRRLLKRSMVRD
jgi:hypothetical protein